jgi:hypothetical protein
MRYVVSDLDPNYETRQPDISFEATSPEDAKAQWFALMGLGDDDPDIKLNVWCLDLIVDEAGNPITETLT